MTLKIDKIKFIDVWIKTDILQFQANTGALSRHLTGKM